MDPIQCPFVGLNFRPREAKFRAEQLTEGETLRLVREPENPYDPNAVQVWAAAHETSEQHTEPRAEAFIGFVPKSWSAIVAEAMDGGQTDVTAKILVLPNIMQIDFTAKAEEIEGSDEDGEHDGD